MIIRYAIIEKNPETGLDTVGGVVVVDVSTTNIADMTDLLTVELQDDTIVNIGDIYTGGVFISLEQQY